MKPNGQNCNVCFLFILYLTSVLHYYHRYVHVHNIVWQDVIALSQDSHLPDHVSFAASHPGAEMYSHKQIPTPDVSWVALLYFRFIPIVLPPGKDCIFHCSALFLSGKSFHHLMCRVCACACACVVSFCTGIRRYNGSSDVVRSYRCLVGVGTRALSFSLSSHTFFFLFSLF